MNTKAFLANQLDQTAQIIEWSINLFPEKRLIEIPPHSTVSMKSFFGEWSALRVLFHLFYYEETIALPCLNHWIGGPVPLLPESAQVEKVEWEKCEKKSEILDRFLEIRKKQIETIENIDIKDWDKKKLVYYGHGKVSAHWMVAKTIQHTFAHGDKLIRKALYWDDF
ncbi:MAG: DinB family protein [Candidatus Hodarchaeales archaeon]|jgi:hypothetical protein